MAIAVQLDPDKVSTNQRLPTVKPVGEFELGVAYEFDDEQGQFLLNLPEGPFMRAKLKDARAQAAETEATLAAQAEAPPEVPAPPTEPTPAVEATNAEGAP